MAALEVSSNSESNNEESQDVYDKMKELMSLLAKAKRKIHKP